MFENELFIILGMLFAKYFRAYIYDFGSGKQGGGLSYGGGRGKPNCRTNLKTASTGRGGIVTSKSPSDGENGRPGATDNSTGPTEAGGSGKGADIGAGGTGFHPGGFGFGGFAIGAGAYRGLTQSAGGGSGWFGGGSSFMDAGGGGGSSWCYSYTPDGLSGLSAVVDYNPPPWLSFVEWIGVSESTLDYYENNIELFDVNTRHLDEYNKFRGSLGEAFDAFCRLHTRAAGNGLILISEANKKIEIDRENGSINNILEIIEYSGSSFQWSPPEAGVYEFILWGAQGGTTMYTPAGMQGLTYQQYTGGFGGAIGIFIDLPTTYEDPYGETKDVVIDCLVGQQGSTVKGQSAWNGGGNGSNATGGGGASDLRFESNVGASWQSNLGNRFVVAGGGGGCIGTGNGGTPTSPFTEPSLPGPNDPNFDDEDDWTFPDGEGPQYFLVNDRSIVYVDISYFAQSTIPEGTKLNCTISIDNGREGVLSQDFEIEPVSGFVELTFPLDQLYPVNSETHWVTITAEISGLNQLDMFAIPSSGLIIRVETVAGVNEPNSNTDYNRRTLFGYNIDSFNFGDICRIYFEESPPTGDIHLSTVDGFNFDDSVRIKLKTIENIKISVLEKFNSIVDNIDPRFKNVIVDYIKNIDSFNFDDDANAYNDMPPGDILLHILEQFNLRELVEEQLKQIEDKSSFGTDSFNQSDEASVRLVPVQIVRISNIDSFNIQDKNKEALQ